MSVLETVTVSLGARSYPVHIGKGLLARVPEFLPFNARGRTLFILADEAVAGTYAATLHRALEDAGAHAVHVRAVTGGEAAKSVIELESVLSWMLDHHVDRQSVLFAVGGGVTGDLGGFAAAIALRGIGFVQVPTTLLAQVDSAVGGKTGINMPQGKNMVGSFHQPLAVIADIDTLETLPRRALLAGYAEIVKYALISDPEFFIWLGAHGAELCALEPQALAQAIAVSCRKKAEIVAQDEQEKSGVRALLNLGHTFGHALEAAAGYDGRLLHGEAVAIGMVMAFTLSARLGWCPQEDADRVEAHLKVMGLPVQAADIRPPLSCTAGDIMGFMAHDKKMAQGRLSFVLARGIGKAYLTDDVPPGDVRAVISHSLEGS